MGPAEEIDTFLERALSDFERRNGCHIAIHDHWGFLVTSDRKPFFVNRTLHRAPVCRWRRNEEPDFNHNCVRHCKQRILELSSLTDQPYIGSCWKHLSELVIPIYDRKQLLATMYIGAFRGHDGSGGALDDPEYRALLAGLAPLTAERKADLLHQARMLIMAVLYLYRRQQDRIALPHSGRQKVIVEFIHRNSHRDIGLGDLARHLNLSVSRTSHLVKEFFALSMHDLLRRERIRKAETLLKNEDLSLAEIATMTGFANEFYFNRVFRRLTGITPGRYRRNSLTTPDFEENTKQGLKKTR